MRSCTPRQVVSADRFKVQFFFCLHNLINIFIFDLRLLEKPIEPSVVHSSINAIDHAKLRDVKTTNAFGDLIGRCYC